MILVAIKVFPNPVGTQTNVLKYRQVYTISN